MKVDDDDDESRQRPVRLDTKRPPKKGRRTARICIRGEALGVSLGMHVALAEVSCFQGCWLAGCTRPGRVSDVQLYPSHPHFTFISLSLVSRFCACPSADRNFSSECSTTQAECLVSLWAAAQHRLLTPSCSVAPARCHHESQCDY